MDITENHFVGRGNAVNRLHGVLSGSVSSNDKLTIQSIEGPGGIGKTFLFDHATKGVVLKNRNYITLRIDGNDQSNRTLVNAVKSIVKSADGDVLRSGAPGNYFQEVDRVLKAMDMIRIEAEEEFQKLNPNDKEGLQAFLWLFDRALSVGKGLGGLFPIIEENINFEKLEKYRGMIEKAIPIMESLRSEAGTIFTKLGLFDGDCALRNSIKINACRPLADALVSDLSAILTKYQGRDWLKPKRSKVKGIDNLLLIIDDYEMLQEPLGEFLVGHFLKALRTVNFESVVIVLGRDQLEATHPGWGQHLKPNMLRRIDLSPLPRLEMDQLVESYGVTSSIEKERAWDDTQGYPFYVQLWIEEVESGGPSALMLKRFHDRTTRWMSTLEKDWLQYVLFLDEVNISTLGKMLGNEHSARDVFKWFEGEGSVRDTSGQYFRVRTYIRSRLVDYIRISDPDRFHELHRRGQAAVNHGNEI